MQKVNLEMHTGGFNVSPARLKRIQTPKTTASWFPIAHHLLFQNVCDHIVAQGMRVVGESHAICRNGKLYFGLLQIVNGSKAGDYATVLGVQNSHDQSTPGALLVGSQVFVCDNLAFSGETRISRRHTSGMARELPRLIKSAVAKIAALRRSQDERIAAYKAFELSDVQAHDLIVRGSCDLNIVTTLQMPVVLERWRRPDHPEFGELPSAWRLFNAFTEVLKERNIFKQPRFSGALHAMIDTACGLSS
jgi:hypothetical protein